ncbi:hypothetical protein OAU93_00280 [bacterium]|nr:hypothetical protein [bacterium]
MMKIFVIGLIAGVAACSACHAQQSIPHVDELMKQYDLDKNGALAASEVKGSRYARQYARWDADSDGSVSKEDVIQFRAKFGIAADGSQMSKPSSLPEPTYPRSLKIPSIESLLRVDRDHLPTRQLSSNSEYVLRTQPHEAIGDSYVVLTDHTESNYLEWLNRLADHHGGDVIRVKDLARIGESESELKRLRGELRQRKVKWVAIAPRLETFRENTVLGAWELLSSLDSDVELDCQPGFLVASNFPAFRKLIDQSINYSSISSKNIRPFAISQVQNSTETRSLQKSAMLKSHFKESGIPVPIVAIYGAQADAAPRLPGDQIWNLKVESRKKFVQTMPADATKSLQDSNLVVMHGHGIPGMSCSLDVEGLPSDMSGKILLSGSCFSASPVASDLPSMRQAPGGYEVQPRDAFILRAIDNGAVVAFGHQRLSSGFPHLYPVLESWVEGQTVGAGYQQLINALIEFGGFKSGEFLIQKDQKNNKRLPQNRLLYVVIGDPALQPIQRSN